MNENETLDNRLLSMIITLVDSKLRDWGYDLGRNNTSKTNPDEYPHKVILSNDAGYVTIYGNDEDCIHNCIYDTYIAVYDVIGLRLNEVEGIEVKIMSKIKEQHPKDPESDFVFEDEVICKYEAVVDLRELVDVVKEG